MEIWTIILSFMFILGVAGCNTLSGAGQDMQAAGEAVEESAGDVKDELTDDDDEVLD